MLTYWPCQTCQSHLAMRPHITENSLLSLQELWAGGRFRNISINSALVGPISLSLCVENLPWSRYFLMKVVLLRRFL